LLNSARFITSFISEVSPGEAWCNLSKHIRVQSELWYLWNFSTFTNNDRGYVEYWRLPSNL